MNLGAVVQRTVVEGTEPAREVIHAADGSWLVGDGANDPNVSGACLVLGLRHVVDRDQSMEELASLPPGHIAQRDELDAPWRITVHEWQD